MLEVDSSNVLAIKGLMYIYRILGKEDKLKQLIDHSQNIVYVPRIPSYWTSSIQDNLGYTLEIAKNSYMGMILGSVPERTRRKDWVGTWLFYSMFKEWIFMEIYIFGMENIFFSMILLGVVLDGIQIWTQGGCYSCVFCFDRELYW